MGDAYEGSRAVEVLEVIQNVFELADRQTCAVGARVCSFWSSTALDQLWSSLNSLTPMLGLLSPVDSSTRNERGAQTWSISHPDQVDWHRFSAYARRVRTLWCDDEALINGKRRPIAASVFRDIAFFRATEDVLLPKITSLDWSPTHADTASAVLIFLSPSLKTVTTSIAYLSIAASRVLLTHLTARLSNVVDFTLEASTAATPVASHVARCLEAMPRLRRLRLPQFYLQGVITNATSQLPWLKSLKTTWTDDHDYNEEGMHFHAEEGRFKALQALYIDSHPQYFTDFLSAASYPNLTAIGLGTRKLGDHGLLQRFLEAVAQSCPKVIKLRLNLYSNRDDRSPAERQPIPFSALRPVLACADLTTLIIGHDYPMTLGDRELEEMGAAWKGMVSMDICSDPVIGNVTANAPGTPLSALLTIARAFRNLRALSLYFSKYGLAEVDDRVASPARFQSLSDLLVGTSPVLQNSSEDVAAFLVRLCSQMHIAPQTTQWREAAIGVLDEEDEELMIRHDYWERVDSLVSTLKSYGEHVAQELDHQKGASS